MEVQRIQTLKEAEVAQAEAEKREKELMASVIKPAEATRLAAIAQSDGEKAATIKRAEGDSEATIRKAEGERQRLELEGQGKAAAIRAQGQAEADVIKLKLLAEAEGLLKKAEAYERLEQTGRTLQILEKVKEILPESLERLAPVMGEIAKPIGNVDRISIVDFGGGNSGGGIGRFAQTVPMVLTQFFEAMKAAGLDPTRLQKLLGINPEGSPVDKGEKELREKEL